MNNPITTPKNIIKYMPPNSTTFLTMHKTLSKPTTTANYSYIELPIFESTELFVHNVNESTDIINKKMYTFDNHNNRSLSLHPEGTANIMQTVIEHNLNRGQLPMKLLYANPFFHTEHPQQNHYQQFFQINIKTIGINNPTLDTKIITITNKNYRSLGLTNHQLELTSLNNDTCQPTYQKQLITFLNTLDLNDTTRARAAVNPLRVLDDKRPKIRTQLGDAPLMLDHLCDACAAHFAEVRSHLNALNMRYLLNPHLIHGLNYYTKTTFKFIHNNLNTQSGIGNNKRYDNLITNLNNQPLSNIN